MRHILAIILFCSPMTASASFLLQYGLNYSSQKDSSDAGDFEESRTFSQGLYRRVCEWKENIVLWMEYQFLVIHLESGH